MATFDDGEVVQPSVSPSGMGCVDCDASGSAPQKTAYVPLDLNLAGRIMQRSPTGHNGQTGANGQGAQITGTWDFTVEASSSSGERLNPSMSTNDDRWRPRQSLHLHRICRKHASTARHRRPQGVPGAFGGASRVP